MFVAALHTEEYCELEPHHKIVVVTDNAPAHSGVEESVREMLAADGILNGSKLVILRLAPYSPMLNPIEGCWSVLKASMRHFIIEKREHFLLRGKHATFTAHRLALMKEAVDACRHVLTQRLVWREEHHCLRVCFMAERREDMQLGKYEKIHRSFCLERQSTVDIANETVPLFWSQNLISG